MRERPQPTPLLIMHGASDERVPTGQSLELVRALENRGKSVELVFYPREGHSFGEYYHQRDEMQREYDWIAQVHARPLRRACDTVIGRRGNGMTHTPRACGEVAASGNTERSSTRTRGTPRMGHG